MFVVLRKKKRIKIIKITGMQTNPRPKRSLENFLAG
jgi:hypothetical protein